MNDVEVAVVGGGPSGATVARHLALRGHKVSLFHLTRGSRPSNVRYETISPGAVELLSRNYPDAWSKLQTVFVQCQGMVRWTHGDVVFGNKLAHGSTLVDRRHLDSILLAAAVQAGVKLHSRALDPKRVRFVPDSQRWKLDSTEECRLLVDATGRAAVFGGPRRTIASPLIAITANVAGLNCRPMTTGVESLSDGWLWTAKGNEQDTTVSLFVSTKTTRAWPSRAHSGHFLKVVGNSLFCENKSGLQLSSNLSLRDATPYAREPLNDSGLFWVGDSAFAPDPLSGQGVHQAVLSGLRCGIVLHTILTRKQSERVARDFYSLQHAETVQNHISIARTFYQRQDRFHSDFWNDRGSGASLPIDKPDMAGTVRMQLEHGLAISSNVCWKEISVNAGEFIETRRALCHPSLLRPVAYLEGHPLSEMLDVFSRGVTGSMLVKKWSDRMGILESSGLRHLQFLLNHHILLAKSGPS